MPAQTADGTHIITKGELLDMLKDFDDHDRIQVLHSGWEASEDILASIADKLDVLYGSNKENEREVILDSVKDTLPDGGCWHIDRCQRGDGNLTIFLA